MAIPIVEKTLTLAKHKVAMLFPFWYLIRFYWYPPCRIYLFFTRKIRKEYGRDRYIRDASQTYSGCKDLNEYLQKQTERKRQVQSVKGMRSQSPKKKNGFRL